MTPQARPKRTFVQVDLQQVEGPRARALVGVICSCLGPRNNVKRVALRRHGGRAHPADLVAALYSSKWKDPLARAHSSSRNRPQLGRPPASLTQNVVGGARCAASGSRRATHDSRPAGPGHPAFCVRWRCSFRGGMEGSSAPAHAASSALEEAEQRRRFGMKLYNETEDRDFANTPLWPTNGGTIHQTSAVVVPQAQPRPAHVYHQMAHVVQAPRPVQAVAPLPHQPTQVRVAGAGSGQVASSNSSAAAGAASAAATAHSPAPAPSRLSAMLALKKKELQTAQPK